jgi:hypothetical protein
LSLVTTAGSAAAASSAFHVSLSRTVVLRHHQIEQFVSEIRSALQDLLQRSVLPSAAASHAQAASALPV